jgi:hypothetical protein
MKMLMKEMDMAGVTPSEKTIKARQEAEEAT